MQDDYADTLRFLFQRFTYKVTQTETTQEWYKDQEGMPSKLSSWEQDGCVFMLTQGPPKMLCVRNDSDTPRNIKDEWILQPGESFTTQDVGWINKLANKPSIHEMTPITLKEALDAAAAELKVANECEACGKVLTLGDSFDCPHGDETWNSQEFGTMIPAGLGKPVKKVKKVVYATKQISPVEKPKGRFIKLK